MLLDEADVLARGSGGKKLPAKKQAQIGDLIRRIREATGFGPSEFSSRLGVSRQTLDNWESGSVMPKPWLIRSKLAQLLPSTGPADVIDRFGILFADDVLELLRKPQATAVWIFKCSSFFEGLPQHNRLRQFVWEKMEHGCIFHYAFPQKTTAADTFERFKELTAESSHKDLAGRLMGYCIKDEAFAAQLRLLERRGEVPYAWIAVQYADDPDSNLGRSILASTWDVFLAQAVAEYFDKTRIREKENGQICWIQLPSGPAYISPWQERIQALRNAPRGKVQLIKLSKPKQA